MGKMKILIVLILVVISSWAYAENWHSEASLIYNVKNYPNLDNNEKALMLAKRMEREGESFQVVTTFYRIEGVSVWKDGIRVYPPFRSETKYDGLEVMNEFTKVYEGR